MLKRRKPLVRKNPLRARQPIALASSGRFRTARPQVPKRTLRSAAWVHRKRRVTTPEEKAHMGRIASLGCVVCRNLGRGWRKAMIHHVREGYGASQRAPHWEVLPLCPDHHQHGGMGVAFHAGERTWIRLYGAERTLLRQVLVEAYGENPGPDDAPAAVRVLMGLARLDAAG